MKREYKEHEELHQELSFANNITHIGFCVTKEYIFFCNKNIITVFYITELKCIYVKEK